jgi:hypothetical protein
VVESRVDSVDVVHIGGDTVQSLMSFALEEGGDGRRGRPRKS